MVDGLVEILRPDGTLKKDSTAPSVDTEEQLRIYRAMLLNRRVDERMITLQRQGRIGFYIGSIGEEAAIVGSAFALRDTDWIVPCYRELGAALLRGYPLYDFFCQLFGNRDDAVKGRQMPNHYALRKLRFASISSPVGTQIPQAAGMAMAARIRKSEDVTLCFFGDGATSEGDFHVGANFAGVYKAPVVFLCRNNQWAISVPFSTQTASRNVAVKSEAYGIAGVRVDGNDVLAMIQTTGEAVQRARRGEGATLIEAVTYRLSGHSTSDDPKTYRDDREVVEWERKDPLKRFKAYLIRQGAWSEKRDQALEEEIKNDIAENLKKAESVGPPGIETIFEDVLDRVPWHLKEQIEEVRAVQESETVGQEA